ncbi:MAG: hypothetical protein AUF76_07690 [Acidobacteria bacterium 13_1_20CM_2_65_9]|nr:MAG: hypothetical protein AUF76_07690 [Acidobacteria bacterium 13_1_20CM_2_65_9]
MTRHPQPRGRELEGRVQLQSIAVGLDTDVLKAEARCAAAEGQRLIAGADERVRRGAGGPRDPGSRGEADDREIASRVECELQAGAAGCQRPRAGALVMCDGGIAAGGYGRCPERHATEHDCTKQGQEQSGRQTTTHRDRDP